MDILTTKQQNTQRSVYIITGRLINELRVSKENDTEHVYRWAENVPLESAGKSYVNFFELKIFSPDKKTKERTCTYRSSWVTNLTLAEANIEKMTAAARTPQYIDSGKSKTNVLTISKTGAIASNTTSGMAPNTYHLTSIS